MPNSLIIPSTLPKQDDELIHRLSLRWLRAAEPHAKWAKLARKCINYLEGQQWDEETMALLRSLKRTSLTINKINPLYRLVMGYQSSNRMDVSFLPTSDAMATEDVAKLLTNIFKSESNRTDLKFIDSEVFSDGISGGRGFWDMRLCFEDNDFGEWKPTAADPFSVFLDPDGNTYDIEGSCKYVQESVWTDLDSINSTYGSDAAKACENLYSPNYTSSMLHYFGSEDISPERYFGSYTDDKAMNSFADVYYNDFVDRQAKRLRLLDSQYKITVVAPCFVDLETGDKQVIPDEWLKPENQHKIQAALDYGMAHNNPLKIVRRPVTRTRWTVSCADVTLFDQWSPFETYTKVGFFPYFRRGKTRGMMEDLLDPQDEINKKRSALTDILNRNANSGWIYEENTLDATQEENLRKFGASPGINVKWKRTAKNSEAPRRLEPGGYPQGLDRLEEKNSEDLNGISGINESAMGQMDRVVSGRALEARQRQAVLSIQLYSDNFTRSKKLQGRNALSIFQRHYTEARIFRITNEDSTIAKYEINKKAVMGDNAASQIVNDITVGKYSVNVDEVPMSATFKQAQFEETMELLQKLGPIGAAVAQMNPGLIIDQSSIPRKQEWKQVLQQAAQQQQAIAAAGGGMPPGAAGGEPVGQPVTPEGMPS